MADLNRVIAQFREQILNSDTLNESMRQTGLALRMLTESWAHLPPEIRQEIETQLDAEDVASALETVFQAKGKRVARLSAQHADYRYPTERDVLFASETLYQAHPTPLRDRLEQALLLAPLTAPESTLGARACWMLELFLRLQPLANDQVGTALLITLAFLRMHGASYPSDTSSLQSLAQNPALLEEVSAQDAPNPPTYPEIIESILAESRANLLAVENATRQQALVPLPNLPAAARTTLQPVPGPSSEWRYLTLQDLIWINTEVTKRPQRYAYDRLEEATYYQYSYRQSRDVVRNTARFLWGYLQYRPFEQGNYATALIATLALLHINGYAVHLPVEHASEWLLQVAQRKKHPLDAIRQIVASSQPSKQPIPLREHVHQLIEHYEPALHALMEQETPLSV